MVLPEPSACTPVQPSNRGVRFGSSGSFGTFTTSNDAPNRLANSAVRRELRGLRHRRAVERYDKGAGWGRGRDGEVS